MDVLYLTDEKGKQVAVVLEIKAYRRILKELEELESLRAYDSAKADTGEGGDVLSLEDALAELKQQRAWPTVSPS